MWFLNAWSPEHGADWNFEALLEEVGHWGWALRSIGCPILALAFCSLLCRQVLPHSPTPRTPPSLPRHDGLCPLSEPKAILPPLICFLVSCLVTATRSQLDQGSALEALLSSALPDSWKQQLPSTGTQGTDRPAPAPWLFSHPRAGPHKAIAHRDHDCLLPC